MPGNSVIFQVVPATAHEEITTMSSENDVPLGDGSRRYYQELFDERIRQINKENGSRRPDKGDSNNNGRLGCGALIAVFLFIRIFTVFLNSHSHTSSFSSSPPPPPRLKFQQPILIDPPGIDAREEDERRLLDQLFKEAAEEEEKPMRLPPGNRVPERAKR
jgi:hypothetical protein